MRTLRLYQTEDGSTFENRRDATIHELKTDAQNQLLKVLQVSVRTGRADAVVKQMVEEATAVREILLKMTSKMPKPKRKKAV